MDKKARLTGIYEKIINKLSGMSSLQGTATNKNANKGNYINFDLAVNLGIRVERCSMLPNCHILLFCFIRIRNVSNVDKICFSIRQDYF